MLAPGVVLRGGDIGIGIAPQLSVRGSPLGEASVYVDGAPVRFQLFGAQALSLGTLGIDAVAVTTGVPDATVADARGGGVISYVTGSGSATLTGHWRTETDRSEEHTSELQSRLHLVCRLLLEKKKKQN